MKKGIVVLVIIVLAACRSIGPDEIYLDRTRYNDVIADTTDQEMLRNIVRLRYMHQVSVLEITNIISSYTYSPSVSGTFDFIRKPVTNSAISPIGSLFANREFGSITPGISYSDQPTISYMPVEDSDFIRKMLVPVETHFLSLMVSGGMHDPHLLFNLTIKRINAAINEYNGSNLHLFSQQHYRKFHRVADRLDQLTAKRGVRLVPVKVGDSHTLAIHFSEAANQSPEALEIKKILHIPMPYQDIILYYKKLPLPNMAVIHTRSILGSLIFLSSGVEVPAEHVSRHIVRQFKAADGKVYNWNPLMKNIIRIHSSKEKPDNAYLAASIYGYWYYIERGDIRSIATFTYQRVLHGLTSGRELQNMGFKTKQSSERVSRVDHGQNEDDEKDAKVGDKKRLAAADGGEVTADVATAQKSSKSTGNTAGTSGVKP